MFPRIKSKNIKWNANTVAHHTNSQMWYPIKKNPKKTGMQSSKEKNQSVQTDAEMTQIKE